MPFKVPQVPNRPPSTNGWALLPRPRKIGGDILLIVTTFILGVTFRASAEEDEVEEDGVVEEEDEEVGDPDTEEEDDSGEKKHVSADAETILLFTRPPVASGAVELPAGQIVEFLVGFTNKGEEGDFIIETLDASFRYPMDFTYHIQNFSAIAYQKTVKPRQEATVSYSFIPADAFAGRPIGLTINLAYRDTEGNFFFDPVFNETVQIVEFDEGFDTEVFFMYIMMAAVGILALFLVYNFTAGMDWHYVYSFCHADANGKIFLNHLILCRPLKGQEAAATQGSGDWDDQRRRRL